MKPWMRRRSGESKQQHASRLAHSCYRCGVRIGDLRELDRHEDTCASDPPHPERRSEDA